MDSIIQKYVHSGPRDPFIFICDALPDIHELSDHTVIILQLMGMSV